MQKTLRTIAALAASAGLLVGATAPSFAMGVRAPNAIAKPFAAGAAVEQVRWEWRNGRRAWVGPRGNWGGAAAAGIIGLAAGAIIAGAATANQQANEDAEYNQWLSYCQQRYGRYFDPQSGTYMASDGRRYPCE